MRACGIVSFVSVFQEAGNSHQLRVSKKEETLRFEARREGMKLMSGGRGNGNIVGWSVLLRTFLR